MSFTMVIVSRRVFPLIVVGVLGIAACGGGGDDAEPATSSPTTTVATTDEAPATTEVPATTEPAASTTTATPTTTEAPPPPGPIIRQRLVVTGPEEIVWDWTTDRCEDAHIPDIAARAFRNADGELNLTISHWDSYPMVGTTFDDLATDCTRRQLTSDYDPDPAAFNDSEWIGSVFTEDGQTVYAIVHNEYRGDTHGIAGQCPSGQRLPCLDTSFTLAVSTDGGRTFDHAAPPPNHLIATLPYTYRDDTVPSGIRQPSNVVDGGDGFYYLFGNVSDQPAEEQWVCAMRTPDLADPAAWRYWTGTDFTGVWKNPYVDEVTSTDKCAPYALGALTGSVQETIVFDEALDRWVMVGVAFDAFGVGPNWGFYYATSADLIEWTTREFLLEVPVTPSVADDGNDVYYAYPSLIDPDSESLSFGTSDGELYLYLTRFNAGGNSLDRDLVRWPVAVEEYEVEVPEWTFDDESDLDESAGGWTARFDVEPLTVADGALQFTTTGDDPHFQSGAIVVPSEFDVLTIRMRLPEGLTSFGELFWVTDLDGELDGDKYEDFNVDGTGEFEDIRIDLSTNPEWTGTIRSIRIDPVVSGTDVVGQIDRIWFERSS
ncbi:MAG: hypothetical protein AAGG08_03975 [Actinomycetota bacterium]